MLREQIAGGPVYAHLVAFLRRISELADNFALDIWNVNDQLRSPLLYKNSDIEGAIIIPAARAAEGCMRYLVQLRTGEGCFCVLVSREAVQLGSTPGGFMLSSDDAGALYWSKREYLPSEPEKIPEKHVENLKLRTRFSLSPMGSGTYEPLGVVWSFWKFRFWKDLNSIHGATTHEEIFALRRGYSYDLEAVLRTIPVG